MIQAGSLLASRLLGYNASGDEIGMLVLPSEVTDPQAFQEQYAGSGYDFTECRFLDVEAVPGLIEIARHQPVTLCIWLESQPAKLLTRLFGSSLRRTSEDRWTLDLSAPASAGRLGNGRSNYRASGPRRNGRG